MRRIFISGQSHTTRTWNGERGVVGLMALIFLLVTFWLAFHEQMLGSPGALLLCIPAAFTVLFAAAVFFASDRCMGWLMSFLSAC